MAEQPDDPRERCEPEANSGERKDLQGTTPSGNAAVQPEACTFVAPQQTSIKDSATEWAEDVTRCVGRLLPLSRPQTSKGTQE
jgi:hypothetical protein